MLFVLCISCSDSKNYFEENQKKSGELTSFKFEKSKNPQLKEDVVLTIYDNGNVFGYLTYEVDITALKPTFEVENGTFFHNNYLVENGTTSFDFTNPERFELLGNNGNKTQINVNLLPYTGLPVAIIHTEKEKAILNKEDWVPTHMTIDGMGNFENYSDSAFVRGRGNSTWGFPKKAFNMKLQSKDPVLGMPAHKRWSFLANYRDRTLLRNDVTFHIGELADNLAWTPRSQFAEVVFNGEHIGNFQITEHVRVDKNRVNIKEMKASDLEEEKITGGYLLELDEFFDEINKFRSEYYNLPVNIKNPDEEVLQEAQKAYIEGYISEIEKALINKDYDTAYNLIDINSFIDYWIVQALVGNTEMADPRSVFCHKDRAQKLNMGPLWDFDYTTFVTEGERFESKNTLHFSAFWYESLFSDPQFSKAAKERFYELKPKLKKVPAYITERSQYLSASVEANWELWKINVNVVRYLNGDETLTYQEAIDRMISIYEARLDLLENEINKRVQ